ncbi:hypothetical protein [Sporosarcina pasteurii]|uniref:Uncharacterized protein n=1 Tax=Sporosarcina pasteurii TaxID=1474 RepID=A0A380BMA3_SPOPA|nr:hypothetical protein [Sporosarcina pasteurii]MDS9470890.1 hypothetical protein [Sporosarcina pasteurii]QBQ05450.1 hypothetical protein E2C16_07100 [Sporosarcina pasteurii]SUJ03165.1 Uncharacterised protein [Sporosarcina pasteurii]
MKKLLVGFIAGAVLFGGATFGFAHSTGNEFFDFEDMKPHMEEMHPNFSPQQYEQMYKDCHGENGFMHPHMRSRHFNE